MKLLFCISQYFEGILRFTSLRFTFSVKTFENQTDVLIIYADKYQTKIAHNLLNLLINL